MLQSRLLPPWLVATSKNFSVDFPNFQQLNVFDLVAPVIMWDSSLLDNFCRGLFNFLLQTPKGTNFINNFFLLVLCMTHTIKNKWLQHWTSKKKVVLYQNYVSIMNDINCFKQNLSFAVPKSWSIYYKTPRYILL